MVLKQRINTYEENLVEEMKEIVKTEVMECFPIKYPLLSKTSS